MGIDIKNFARHSPYLFHLTYEQSLQRIHRVNKLESTGRLLELAGQSHMIRVKREKPLPLQIGDDRLELTDQTPLNEKNIRFEDGWGVADLVESVNKRVFFWRGGEAGLLKADQGQFNRYTGEGKSLVFLRIPFSDAIAKNPGRLEFCKYNSGGARQHPKTGKSPRGISTFATPANAPFDIAEIREVTFLDYFDFPESTTMCFGSWLGPWQPLKDYAT